MILKRPTNGGKDIHVVKGKRVNRGGGFGLEVPCVYQFEVTVFLVVGFNRNW